MSLLLGLKRIYWRKLALLRAIPFTTTWPRLRFAWYYYRMKWCVPCQLHLRSKEAHARAQGYTGGGVSSNEGAFLYALLRSIKPQIAFETGVGGGFSSFYLLKAIKANGYGKLVSIDLPGEDLRIYPGIGKHADQHIPEHWECGWMVPENLRKYWELHLGDSKTLLPLLLTEYEAIQFFFHDSLHTEDHMMFEYSLASKYLSNRGLLCSHDVNAYWSDCFIRYANENQFKSFYFESLGIGMK